MSSDNFNENVPALLYVLSALFTIIPAVAVTFRFQVRFRSRVKLAADDWTILVALVNLISSHLSSI
jgi:uncharacterized membrane protein YhaH (DUF805 family)